MKTLKPKPSKDIRVPLAVVGGIVLLESIALYKGIDGKVLTAVISALTLIAGFKLRELFR